MLPIKPNQELTNRPDTIFMRVPQHFYEILWDIAYGMVIRDVPVEKRQKRIYNELMEWIEIKYPGYGLVWFQDLRDEEAKEISTRIGKPVMWGMYILLQVGGSMQPMDITQLFIEGPKLIE